LDQNPKDGTNQIGVMTPGAGLGAYSARKFSECLLE
jgi:hypothetical protein